MGTGTRYCGRKPDSIASETNVLTVVPELGPFPENVNMSWALSLPILSTDLMAKISWSK